jgi:CheY-like chemotaxis protein
MEALEPMRVLVVDDSDMNRKMVCKVLTATKEFHCEQAVDGNVAVEMVRRQLQRILEDDDESHDCYYDIILMDYQMPNMDGPTAITEIRKLGYSSIILGLTGNALLSDRDAMLKAGANGVLVKPLNLELFRDTLRVLSTKK